jgi:hypothetical protein
MRVKELVKIHRADNGWLVTITEQYSEKTVLCVTWEDVLEQVRYACFWFNGEIKGK